MQGCKRNQLWAWAPHASTVQVGYISCLCVFFLNLCWRGDISFSVPQFAVYPPSAPWEHIHIFHMWQAAEDEEIRKLQYRNVRSSLDWMRAPFCTKCIKHVGLGCSIFRHLKTQLKPCCQCRSMCSCSGDDSTEAMEDLERMISKMSLSWCRLRDVWGLMHYKWAFGSRAIICAKNPEVVTTFVKLKYTIKWRELRSVDVWT